jgi:hypothetical protein
MTVEQNGANEAKICESRYLRSEQCKSIIEPTGGLLWRINPNQEKNL